MRIAIDGPCAAGKTTTAKELARRLHFAYIDTGAMFRAVALYCKRNNISEDDVHAHMAEITANVGCDIIQDDKNSRFVMYVEKDAPAVDDTMLRTPDIAMLASTLSKQPCVRDFVMILENQMRDTAGDIIMEGRDICSVVMPDADLKFFMTAELATRALRRQSDIYAKGDITFIPFREVFDDVKRRDEQDITRKVAPLVRTEDSVLIDNTNLTFNETVSIMELLINSRMPQCI